MSLLLAGSKQRQPFLSSRSLIICVIPIIRPPAGRRSPNNGGWANRILRPAGLRGFWARTRFLPKSYRQARPQATSNLVRFQIILITMDDTSRRCGSPPQTAEVSMASVDDVNNNNVTVPIVMCRNGH